MQIAGFLLAGIGIWLISRSEGVVGRPRRDRHGHGGGVWLRGYFLCIHQAGDTSVFWLAGTSRFVSLLTTGAIGAGDAAIRSHRFRGSEVGLGAGVLDISGSALFMRCQPAGTGL